MLRKQKKLLVYLLICLSVFLLLSLFSSVFHSARMTVVQTTSLPIRILMFPVNELKKVFTYRSTYARYMQLKKDVDLLRSRLIGQEEILRENNRFRKLLEFKQTLVFSSVAASVIGRDPSNWNAIVLINRGSNDGLKIGMPVINALGVVGKIAEVGATTSKVLLISDPRFSIAALTKRTREGGLIAGSLSGMCRMQHLSLDADIDIGDRVITSKLSSSFPEGLLIGEVIDAYESPSSPTIECIVEPAISLSQLEEVLIIKSDKQ